MSNENTLRSIIEFLILNDSVDCVEWRNLKIFVMGGQYNAEHYYTLELNHDEIIINETISETFYSSEFIEQVLKWVKQNEN